MAQAKFDVGDLVRVTITFSVGGSNIDPTGLTFRHKDPSGNTSATFTYGTSSEVVRESTGVYYSDVSVDEAGVWRVRWATTGTYQSAVEDDFYVRTSNF